MQWLCVACGQSILGNDCPNRCTGDARRFILELQVTVDDGSGEARGFVDDAAALKILRMSESEVALFRKLAAKHGKLSFVRGKHSEAGRFDSSYNTDSDAQQQLASRIYRADVARELVL
jgi:hypothetical protein